MKGRRWDDAVEILRVAKIYACHSYDFFFFFRGGAWRTASRRAGRRLRHSGSST